MRILQYTKKETQMKKLLILGDLYVYDRLSVLKGKYEY